MNFCNKSVSSFTIVTATCPKNTPVSRKIIYLSDKIWQNEMGPLIAYEFSRISYDMIHIDGGVILRGSVEMMEATKHVLISQLAQCKNTTITGMKLVIKLIWVTTDQAKGPEMYKKSTPLNV